jgi:hypothetical protein
LPGKIISLVMRFLFNFFDIFATIIIYRLEIIYCPFLNEKTGGNKKMKLDEIWDKVWTRARYLAKDIVPFLFQLLVWGAGIFIIAFFAAKEFCEKSMKLIRER